MIYHLTSDLVTFKKLEFRSGLNILLAEKSAGATQLQTRNGAGKTCLIETIHFLTGARCKPDAMFRNPALANATFSMDFDLGGNRTRVSRSGKSHSKVVVEGDATSWPLPAYRQQNIGSIFLSNEDWKTILGSMIFGLRYIDSSSPWQPTFRSLFSYFVRRERAGGFAGPFQQSAKQLVWDQQVALSHLLGLDWSIAQEWQAVREKEKNLSELRKAMTEGAFGPLVESAASLRSHLAVAEERSRKLKAGLASFRVLEQYHDLEAEASKLTNDLSGFADENALDLRYLAELEAATTSEAVPDPTDLEALWKEAGIALPESIKKRYEDVQQFHDSVIRNRRAYLLSEMEATRRRISERERKKAELDGRRALVMSTLRSHGALEHYTALQVDLARLEAQAETLRQRYESADALEQGRVAMTAQRAHLLNRLQQDYREQRETLDRATVVFSEISRRLYEQNGQLVIAAKETGPTFEINIHAEDSRGISNMQIFCFDMTLMTLCAERRLGPGFLVHDSHLFDGVDERQTGRALQLGARLAEERGFQYIVTMNSDAVPRDLPVGFSVRDFTLPVVLTDSTEDGGLFGVTFE